MPKSKQRKGHAKRIANRNQMVNAQKHKMQKMFDEAIQKQMEELKKQKETQSEETQNPETNEVGLIQSDAGL
jgi:hypothetical protein